MKRRADTDERHAILVRTTAGMVGLSFSGKGITGIDLPQTGRGRGTAKSGGTAAPGRVPSLGRKAAVLLRRYFSGRRVSFALPLDLREATDFQRAVWKAAAKIPYGETRSYGWIAKKIGRPKAARAVGQALGDNPVPIIVACHRVIGSSGGLGGFSGGLPMKRYLLGLEARKSSCSGVRHGKRTDR